MIMTRLVKVFIILFFGLVLLVHVSALATDNKDFSTDPKTNNGKKWRIGYYEGGEYFEYQRNFIMLVKELMELGWIETADIPEQKGEQTKDIWKWLVAKAKSKYIQFVKDAHYTAMWDDNIRKKMAPEIISRLNQKKDIDIFLAMGTWAGKDTANDKHNVPTMVMGTANPLQSGIIKSVEDSGYDHIHARIDPFRFERQLRIFHDVIEFKKLGVIYENTPAGRTYSAMDEVEKSAGERGFEIIRCNALSDVDVEVAVKEVERCFRELVKKAGAIYVPVHGGIIPKTVSVLVKIVNSNRIPTFVMTGSEYVKAGFLMSLAMPGFKHVGKFYAETMAKIFNGAKPRQLNQIFEDPAKIAINLRTAKIIGFNVPVDIIGAADEVYVEITPPKE